VAGEEVLDVGGVDPAGRAEPVAGKFSPPDPVADGAVAHGEAARDRSVKKAGLLDFLSMPSMSKLRGVCVG
jgi:hypothetical protein